MTQTIDTQKITIGKAAIIFIFVGQPHGYNFEVFYRVKPAEY